MYALKTEAPVDGCSVRMINSEDYLCLSSQESGDAESREGIFPFCVWEMMGAWTGIFALQIFSKKMFRVLVEKESRMWKNMSMMT